MHMSNSPYVQYFFTVIILIGHESRINGSIAFLTFKSREEQFINHSLGLLAFNQENHTPLYYHLKRMLIHLTPAGLNEASCYIKHH